MAQENDIEKHSDEIAEFRIGLMMCMSRGHDGRTGYGEVLGETPDILEWLDFDFYDRVWYHDVTDVGPGVGDEHQKPGRWLGVSHRVRADMCYWILTQSGKILARTTVQHVTQDAILNDESKKRLDNFETAIQIQLGDAGFIDSTVTPGTLMLDEYNSIDQEYLLYMYGDRTNTPLDSEYGQAM
jgi:hypothetical protein